MKNFLLITLAAFGVCCAGAQSSFSPVDSKLVATKSGDITALVCSGPAINVKFQLKRTVTVPSQNNIVNIDGQAIQITPLKIDGFKDAANDQKQLLDAYTKYELAYFKNVLKVEIINSSDQWVDIKSRGWFIWYFKVGNAPVKVDKQTKIELFASTVIGDKVLTINAPIMGDDEFTKAGIIVNDLMEGLTVAK